MISIKLKRPEFICAAFIPIFIILGLIAGGKQLDIQLYTTYYVIHYEHLLIGSVMLMLIFAIIYKFLVKKNISTFSGLTKLHLILSISGLLILMLIASITGGLTEGDNLGLDLSSSFLFIGAILISLISIAIGTMMLLINVLMDLFK